MKRILLITVAVLFSFAQVNADNMSEGFRIGISVSNTEVNGSGSETLRTTKKQSAVASVSETTTIGHVFAERTFSNGFTLGVDYVPGEADVGTKTRADDDFDSTGGNKASAVVSEHLTLYGLMPMGSSPFFIKAGIISMDVETKEKLGTGSTYGNTSINGVTAGIGAHFERDNGIYVRIEHSRSEYEDIRLTSSGSNIVEADLDTTAMKFSIGKSF